MTEAPPISTPETTAAPASGWPTVIGLIEVVFGSFAILGSCAGLAMLLLLPTFQGMMDDMVEQGAPAGSTIGLQGMTQYQLPMLIINVIGLGVAVLLLCAGIATLRRRPFARPGAFIWAACKLPLVVVSSVMSYLINRASFSALPEDDPAAAMMNTGMMDAVSLGGTCFALLWGSALPVFLIIWYSRAKIRTEVAGWGDAGGAYDVGEHA